MNVLLTSAGRRSYLVHYFKQALGSKGKVIVCNSIPNSPAINIADKGYIVPNSFEDGYIDVLVNICLDNKIDYLFSLHDLDGIVISKNKKLFEDRGIKMFISNSKIMNICLDKYRSYNFLIENGIRVPATWNSPESFIKDNENNQYPVIIKPRWGFGSLDILTANNEEELFFLYNYFEKRKSISILKYLGFAPDEPATIIQQYLNNKEFGLGIVNDLNSCYRGAFMMEKLGMRSGETDKAKIIEDDKLLKIAESLSKLLGHVGLLDCDLFFKNNEYYVLELNPRFGGQYPFAHEAGANLPAFFIGVDSKLTLPTVGIQCYKDICLKNF